MLDQPGVWPLALDGHHQRRGCQLGTQVIAHKSVNDFARVQVHNGGDREEMTAVRRPHATALSDEAAYAMMAHQALDPAAAHWHNNVGCRQTLPATDVGVRPLLTTRSTTWRLLSYV